MWKRDQQHTLPQRQGKRGGGSAADSLKKLHYIHLRLDEHIPIREIERKYGISNSLVSAWVKRYLEDGEEALEPKSGTENVVVVRRIRQRDLQAWKSSPDFAAVPGG